MLTYIKKKLNLQNKIIQKYKCKNSRKYKKWNLNFSSYYSFYM